VGLFSKKLTPLTYKEVTEALECLGFELQPKKGTAHEQWVMISKKKKYKVTVDKHESPFTVTLIKSMANQAGMNHREFHTLCKEGLEQKRINELLNQIL
jgi:YcfA-like protein.